MKIIFLDIDGVINNTDWIHEQHTLKKLNKAKKEQKELSKEEFYGEMLNPEMIVNLNRIILLTGAKVVISSTWRNGLEVEQLQRMFDKKGFKGEIIGKTPNLRDQDSVRGNEIASWIRTNVGILGVKYDGYFNEYVILDDDSDMLYSQRNNFICIDGGPGLTETMAYRAMRILKLSKNWEETDG